jgi:hypothetical protein
MIPRILCVSNRAFPPLVPDGNASRFQIERSTFGCERRAEPSGWGSKKPVLKLVLRPVLEVNDRHPRIALPYVSPTLAERTSSTAATFYALVNDMVYVNPRWMLKQRALMVDAMYAATHPVWTFSDVGEQSASCGQRASLETGPVTSDTAEKFIKKITDIP